MASLFRLLVLVLISTVLNGAEKPPGHLKKLGSHREPQGVTMIGKFSAPAVFYQHFVKPGKPLWMRSVLDSVNHPGLTNWTDAFFKKKFGSETVKIETSKKENRKSKPKWLKFRQFLSEYKTEEIYLVHTLNNKMAELALVPTTLQCGGFQNAIQDAVLWMGSGDTMSVLHRDDLDNLLCLLDGQKDFVLIDKAYKLDVEADGFVESEGYSVVNVLKVDMVKFPRFASLPWQKVHLNKGDCIFIPKGWYHQVTSSKHRHLAVNLWFSHLLWFNSGNCSEDEELYRPLEPISTFGFATPNEVYRSKLLEKLSDKGIMLKHVFVSSLDTSTEERRTKFFEAVDRYKDSVLSWSELYGFDIDKAVVRFPDIFDLPGSSLSSADENVVLYEPVPEFDDSPDKQKSTGDDSDHKQQCTGDDSDHKQQCTDDDSDHKEQCTGDDSDHKQQCTSGVISSSESVGVDLHLNAHASNKDKGSMYKHEQPGNNILSSESSGIDSNVNVAKEPLPDDPVVVDAFHSEDHWNIHDQSRPSDGSEVETFAHEHTDSSYSPLTESHEDASKPHNTEKTKDEL